MSQNINSGTAVANILGGVSAEGSYELSSDDLFTIDSETPAWSYTEMTQILSTKILNLNSITGKIRVSYQYRAASSQSMSVQIYKNGLPHGTKKTTSSTSIQTFVEDLDFESGDTIELWGSRTTTSTEKIYTYKILGDNVEQVNGLVLE